MATTKRSVKRPARKTSKTRASGATSVPDLFATATFDVAELIVSNPVGLAAFVKIAERQLKSKPKADQPFVYAPVTKTDVKRFVALATDESSVQEAGEWLCAHGVSESSIIAAVEAIRKSRVNANTPAARKLMKTFNRYIITCDLMEMWALFLMKLEQLEEVSA